MQTKVYTVRGLIFYLLLAIIMGAGIYYGGTYLTGKYFESYKKKIDKNGLLIRAEVFGKKEHKGHLVYFTYDYKGKTYKEDQQNGDYYEVLKIGDIIDIMIDTTNPENSYIYLPDVKTNNY